MRKLFTPENNWTCLPILETSMDNCVQCNSCSAACHLYEMSGQNEMYRPNFRSEIFRRIYKQYVNEGAAGPLALRRHEPELENRGLFYDDAQLARIALQHMQAAKKLGVKKLVIGECGHANKTLSVIADRVLPYDMTVPRESCYVTLRDIVMSGKLKLDPSRNDFPVTLHAPCNVVRLMGIVEPQREILRKIAPKFREMPCHGVNNFCGGGSGFAIMSRNNIEEWRDNISGRKKMWQISEAFKDCLGPETKKYICAPSSNCKGQIRELLAHSDLYSKNSFAYGGLVELIVNCMENVKPGFIKWEGEEEEM